MTRRDASPATTATAPLLGRLREAADAVLSRTALRPRIGVVLGSGLGAFAAALEQAATVPFGEIPHFPTSTVEGHGGALVVGLCAGVPVVVSKGRVHLYEGYSLQDVVFPVRVLGQLGVDTLLVTNAAGAINPLYEPGDLMIIEDHLNLLGNPLVGPNEAALGPRFPDMSGAYDRALSDLAETACRAVGVRAHRGVYVAMSGPSYETPAEIRMTRVLGADAVGMSTVPEVIAGRHMGMRVVGLSCLTNRAAGVSDGILDHREVLATAERVQSALLAVLTRIVREAATA